MADWSDIRDLWWLQPQPESNRALRGMALGAQMQQNRTENAWREEQAQSLIDQRKAALQTHEAKTRGIAAMSSYMSEVAANNAWTNPAAKAGFYKLGAQYPQAIDDPSMQAMARNFEMAEARQAQANQHAQTTSITELTAADKYEQIATQMESLGVLDAEMNTQASNLRQRAQLLRAKMVPPGETIRTYGPDGQIVSEIIRGGTGKAPVAPEELTVATRTKLQQDLMGYADVAEALAYINKNKDASDFGVRGKFKELYARVAGQLGVPVPEGTISVRTAVGTLQAGLVRALRSDSNIGIQEREQIMKMVPSAADITESYSTAIDKLNEVTRRVWGSSKRAAEKLQMKWSPPWLRTPDELWQDYKQGRYGPEGLEAEEKLKADLRGYHFGP